MGRGHTQPSSDLIAQILIASQFDGREAVPINGISRLNYKAKFSHCVITSGSVIKVSHSSTTETLALRLGRDRGEK
jgi:hypothetical protein